MLRNTFLHVPGVGPKTEKKLWTGGIRTWEDFLSKNKKTGMTQGMAKRTEKCLKKSVNCCEKGDYQFLREMMPPGIHWRAYREFAERKRCCFLDIETTGLGSWDVITMIGLFDGKKSRTFIRGRNLKDFASAIKDYGLMVTFNGKCFDVPFIRGELSGADMDLFHVDLRFEMRKLGYMGGLKMIEKKLGIQRSEETQGMDGFEAVALWKRYERGDKGALKLLMDYNREDVENLKPLMEFAYEKLRKEVFPGF
ncbi:MAG: ribonuclease H-like domain-containing protein [Candidatus Aenigmarchaeota archaeon]|nr:ribonuclease H-like domain-containing protein [Candidatus Aenigmarchaeota archaeon]